LLHQLFDAVHAAKFKHFFGLLCIRTDVTI
jgi:hypothetical protein